MIQIHYTNSGWLTQIYTKFVYQAVSKCIVFLNDTAHRIWKELETHKSGQIEFDLFEPALVIDEVNVYQFQLRAHYIQYISIHISNTSEDQTNLNEIYIYEGPSSTYPELCLWRGKLSHSDRQLHISTDAFQAFITIYKKSTKGVNLACHYRWHFLEMNMQFNKLQPKKSDLVMFPNSQCDGNSKVLLCFLQLLAPSNQLAQWKST